MMLCVVVVLEEEGERVCVWWLLWCFVGMLLLCDWLCTKGLSMGVRRRFL